MRYTRKYAITSKIENVKIIDVIEKKYSYTNRNGDKKHGRHLEIECENLSNYEQFVLKDYNVDNIDRYNKGAIGTFEVQNRFEENFREATDTYALAKIYFSVVEFYPNGQTNYAGGSFYAEGGTF